jgi:hypothetical protein
MDARAETQRRRERARTSHRRGLQWNTEEEIPLTWIDRIGAGRIIALPARLLFHITWLLVQRRWDAEKDEGPGREGREDGRKKG